MSVDEDPFKPVDDPQEKPVARRGRPRKDATPVTNETPQPDQGHPGEVGLSLKFGPGHGDPMFHMKAKDIYTLAALVGYDGDTDVSTKKFAQGLLTWWSQICRDIQKIHKPQGEEAPTARTGRNNSSQSGLRRDSGARRQEDDADTDWMYDQETPPECKHGEWRPVTKKGAKGRWFAWGCPGNKDDSCSNGLEFVNRGK